MKPLLPVITPNNAARLTRVRQLGSPRTEVGRGQHLGFAPTGNHLFAKDKSGSGMRWWKSLGDAEETAGDGEFTLAAFKPGFIRDSSIVGIGAPVAAAAVPWRYRLMDLSVENGELRREAALPSTVSGFGTSWNDLALVLMEEDEAQLWNLDTWRLVRGLGGIDAPARVTGCAFSPEGRYVAAVGTLDDGTQSGIWLWDLEKGTGPDYLPLTARFIWSVAFHPSEPLLVAGGDTIVVDVVDVKEVRITRTLKNFYCLPSSLNFNPAGDLLVVGGAGQSFAVHRFDTGARMFSHEDDNEFQSSDALFSPDGRFIAWGQGDGTVGLWGVASVS
ncbi:WD40 repeat domain-containing protein [Corallococcus aberystwythensis]|nr:WD40 repeat domain-containing protein [Corallococcus aberystwythensis]